MNSFDITSSTSLEQLQKWSRQFSLPLAGSLAQAPLVRDRTPLAPYAFVKKRGILPLEEKEGKIVVAIADPLHLESLEEIRLLLGKDTIELLAPLEEIERAIEMSYQEQQEKTSDVVASFKEESSLMQEEEGYDLLDHRADSPIIRLLNAILLEAIRQGASDIHFEPQETELHVRYRIDGVLQARHSPPKELQAQLITRMKVLSQLDIAEQRLPQDGRLKLRMGGRQIDFRVSTVPCVFGERIVLRILDKSNVLVGLPKIGLREPLLSSFQKMIQLSEGIILVTGPTGSGKTTTLYSALSKINSSKVNIMTIEDPVEYKLQGMAQIGVNHKIELYFSTGLRHILRQDPDVIMIGEIRDKETAEIAIQASLTGHLVLSNLHTNDAPSALTRLIDMGIEPYLLTSSVVGVLAQRLVRCICRHCIDSYIPSEEERKSLRVLEEKPFFRGRGCEHCFGSGYKGRRGIYELMLLTAPLKKQLLHSADAHQLQEMAIHLGMSTLREEGALLVVEGVTTSEEVLRATRGIEETS